MNKVENRVKCGVLGATGMVGQKFLELLSEHPWIDVVVVAASHRSAGVKMKVKIPLEEQVLISRDILELVIKDVNQIDEIAEQVDFVFCALDMADDEIIKLEEAYAKKEVVVISNNSATRNFVYVPMIVPEINGVEHLKIIDIQKKILGTNYGCVVVKPNCAAQSFMVIIDALRKNNVLFETVIVSLMQAISGYGKHLEDVHEIQKNILPLPGEAFKSKTEPLKIFGEIQNNKIVQTTNINFCTSAYRVPVEDGHTANIFIEILSGLTDIEDIKKSFNNYNPLSIYKLPSSPKQPLVYLGDKKYPNPLSHSKNQKGMEFTCGAMSYDDNSSILQITGLIHNLIRGAAGGAVLTAELMIKLGYIKNMH